MQQNGRGPGSFGTGGATDADVPSLTVDAAPGRVRVLRLTGELDVAVAPELIPRVPELVGDGDGAGVLLDLTAVSFFDSAGVRLVDRLARECGRIGVSFVVVAPPGRPPARVLQIVGFGPPLVAGDLDTGLAALRG